VTVTGPAGYNQQLASTQILDVNPGSYTITAMPVIQATSIYEPTKVVQTAIVSTSAPASVEIAYSVLSYSYTAIDYPGAASTIATGINNSGQIVGWYTDENENDHGFVYSNNTFTSFNCPLDTSAPGSITETWVYGISDSGKVVGYCMDVDPPYSPFSGGFAEYGFLYVNGSFAAISFPKAFETLPFAINADNRIAGYYENNDTDPQGDAQGFTYDADSGSYTSINLSGATDTEIVGINSVGDLLGYAVIDGPHGGAEVAGFTHSVGQFTPLGITGVPNGFNNFDQIVGYYYSQTPPMGFVSMEETLLEITFPSSQQTFANGTNDNAEVVGYYSDSSQIAHGFVAAPVTSQ
jgi:probable HAF family extracellular repeat protein